MQLTVDNLSKNYRGGVHALRNVQLSLKPGVLGLLGPNGAGKSTLMRILATITQASSGRVLWNDNDIAHNPDALRGALGYLPQDFGVYPNLSAIEFLDYLAAVKGIPAAAARRRISELLALALGTFSGTGKPFEGLLPAIWYVGPMNHTPGLDFTGTASGPHTVSYTLPTSPSQPRFSSPRAPSASANSARSS
jgi:hypothetical protein